MMFGAFIRKVHVSTPLPAAVASSTGTVIVIQSRFFGFPYQEIS
jgi:hypothetical protein